MGVFLEALKLSLQNLWITFKGLTPLPLFLFAIVLTLFILLLLLVGIFKLVKYLFQKKEGERGGINWTTVFLVTTILAVMWGLTRCAQ